MNIYIKGSFVFLVAVLSIYNPSPLYSQNSEKITFGVVQKSYQASGKDTIIINRLGIDKITDHLILSTSIHLKNDLEIIRLTTDTLSSNKAQYSNQNYQDYNSGVFNINNEFIAKNKIDYLLNIEHQIINGRFNLWFGLSKIRNNSEYKTFNSGFIDIESYFSVIDSAGKSLANFILKGSYLCDAVFITAIDSLENNIVKKDYSENQEEGISAIQYFSHGVFNFLNANSNSSINYSEINANGLSDQSISAILDTIHSDFLIFCSFNKITDMSARSSIKIYYKHDSRHPLSSIENTFYLEYSDSYAKLIGSNILKDFNKFCIAGGKEGVSTLNKLTLDSLYRQVLNDYKSKKYSLVVFKSEYTVENRKLPDSLKTKFFNLSGKANIELKNYSAAMESFQNSYMIDSTIKNREALIGFGRVKLSLKEYERALYYFTLDSFDLQNNDPVINNLMGMSNYNLKRINEARHNFYIAFEDTNASYKKWASNYLSRIFVEDFNKDSLVKYLNIYLSGQIDSTYAYDFADFLRTNAQTNLKSKNFSDAELLTKASARINNTPLSRSILLQALLRQNKFTESDSLIESGIKINGNKPADIYKSMANLFRKDTTANGSYDTSSFKIVFHCLFKCLECDPTDPDTYRLLGSSCFRMNKNDSAIYYYKKTIDFDSIYPVNYFNLAEVQLISKNYKDGSYTLKEAKKKIDISIVNEYTNYYNTIFYYYSYASCVLSNSSNCSQYEQKLQNLIDENNTDLNTWSFRTFNKYLENSNIDQELKNKLTTLQSKL